MPSEQEELLREAQELLVGGVDSPIRAAVRPTPFFAERASGSKLWSLDGRELIDWVMGYGPLILGHANERVLRRVIEQVHRGWLYGTQTRAEVELARKLVKYYGPGKVRFVNSGGEAAMTAVRLARAATGRKLIVKFDGCYHGASDQLLAGSSAGVPEELSRLIDVEPYNDPSALEDFMRRRGEEVAAIILEPVAANMGVVPAEEEFLRAARELADESGALLIFDEVVTGFRLGLQGAQGMYGIKPDITALGKIIGGGFPVGAVVAREEIMDLLAPLGPVYNAGTFNGHPITMAAGLATVEILEEGWAYAAAERAAKALAEEAERLLERKGFDVAVQRARSMFQVFFRRPPVRNARDARAADSAAYSRLATALMRGGVFAPPSQTEAWFSSAAHAEEDVSATISAMGGI